VSWDPKRQLPKQPHPPTLSSLPLAIFRGETLGGGTQIGGTGCHPRGGSAHPSSRSTPFRLSTCYNPSNAESETIGNTGSYGGLPCNWPATPCLGASGYPIWYGLERCKRAGGWDIRPCPTLLRASGGGLLRAARAIGLQARLQRVIRDSSGGVDVTPNALPGSNAS